MSNASAPTKFALKAVKEGLRVFMPGSDSNVENWCMGELADTEVGDMLFIFKALPVKQNTGDKTELELESLSLIFRQDTLYPMLYSLFAERYELSFADALLSDAGSKAEENAQNFYYARLRLKQDLSEEQLAKLASMAERFLESGAREQKSEPLVFFLESIGFSLKSDGSLLSLNDLAVSLMPAEEMPQSEVHSQILQYYRICPGSGFSETLKSGNPELTDEGAASEQVWDMLKVDKNKKRQKQSSEDSASRKITKAPAKKGLLDLAAEMELKPEAELSAELEEQKESQTALAPKAVAKISKKGLLDLAAELAAPARSEETKELKSSLPQFEEAEPSFSSGASDFNIENTDLMKYVDELVKKQNQEVDDFTMSELFTKPRREPLVSIPSAGDAADRKGSLEKPSDEKEQDSHSVASEALVQLDEKAKPVVENSRKSLFSMADELEARPRPKAAEKGKRDLFAIAAELGADPQSQGTNLETSKLDLHSNQVHEAAGKRVLKAMAEELAEAKSNAVLKKSEANALIEPLFSAKDKAPEAPAETPSLEAVPRSEKDDAAARKSLSVQATMEKLEEQKQKAFKRIEHFRDEHESACAQGLADLKQRSSRFEQEFAERLKLLRKSVVGKVRLLSIEADQKLSILMEAGRGKIEDRAAPALAELQAVKDAGRIREAFAKLQSDADEFSNLIFDDLQGLEERDLENALEELVQAELQKLLDWRSTNLGEHKRVFDLVIEQLEKRRDSALLDLEKTVNSMRDEMSRMKESDVEQFLLQKAQGDESLGFSFKHTEMHLTRLRDRKLAEQILPLLAELKTALGQRLHEMKGEFVDSLDSHSHDSLRQFDGLLDLGKETLQEISAEIAELRVRVEKEGREKVEQRIYLLNASLEAKLEEFKSSLLPETEDNSSDSLESRLLKRAAQLQSAQMKGSSDTVEEQMRALGERSENLLSSWERDSSSRCEDTTALFEEEIKDFRRRREESLKKLKEKIELLSQKAESIPSEFIE
ncbi:MAG: hypothetical protein K2X27_18805 [Candidatus Obscuribacterales bacterium]|nr:hypothetical protein [Candidatus Obscuribacterales bacterium]